MWLLYTKPQGHKIPLHSSDPSVSPSHAAWVSRALADMRPSPFLWASAWMSLSMRAEPARGSAQWDLSLGTGSTTRAVRTATFRVRVVRKNWEQAVPVLHSSVMPFLQCFLKNKTNPKLCWRKLYFRLKQMLRIILKYSFQPEDAAWFGSRKPDK